MGMKGYWRHFFKLRGCTMRIAHILWAKFSCILLAWHGLPMSMLPSCTMLLNSLWSLPSGFCLVRPARFHTSLNTSASIVLTLLVLKMDQGRILDFFWSRSCSISVDPLCHFHPERIFHFAPLLLDALRTWALIRIKALRLRNLRNTSK